MDRCIYCFPSGYAVAEDGILMEYILPDGSERTGDILMARADRMTPALGCVFADIGRKRDGFLPLQENSHSFSGGSIRSGDRIAVQIKKEEHGGKGAFLTRDLAIPGRFVILMPMNRYVGVSKRIENSEERERLRNIGEAVSGGCFGLVMRLGSLDASEEMIRAETSALLDKWHEAEIRMAESAVPGTVLLALDPGTCILNDYSAQGPLRMIHADSPEPWMESQFRQASERMVRLPGGGNIVIDCCEAMTVIDVNSASQVHGPDKEYTITRVNLEACAAAAAQIRLRNIGLIILFDFIDMDNEEDRFLVEKQLKDAFSADRRKTVIHGWTRLGIMEMTRKRD